MITWTLTFDTASLVGKQAVSDQKVSKGYRWSVWSFSCSVANLWLQDMCHSDVSSVQVDSQVMSCSSCGRVSSTVCGCRTNPCCRYVSLLCGEIQRDFIGSEGNLSLTCDRLKIHKIIKRQREKHRHVRHIQVHETTLISRRPSYVCWLRNTFIFIPIQV